MKTSRPMGSLIIALVVGSALFAASYWVASRARSVASSRQTHELAWLYREFQLTDSESAQARSIHESYIPSCEAMCVRVAAKNGELIEVLNGATNVGPALEAKLAEAALLRVECQVLMLRHFFEISRTLPIDQRSRYLAEMYRVTLGLEGPLEYVSPHQTHAHP